jgi:hypothetical protein
MGSPNRGASVKLITLRPSTISWARNSEGRSVLMRTSRMELLRMVKLLQEQGIDITIHWDYGRPRCYSKNKSVELSPHLPMGQMKAWLDGFEIGSRQVRP